MSKLSSDQEITATTTVVLEGNECPQIDIADKKTEFEITAEIPEDDVDRIDIDIDEGELTITAFDYGIENAVFAHSFTLPENVLTEDIHSIYQDGVLIIHLPKSVGKKAVSYNVRQQIELRPEG